LTVADRPLSIIARSPTVESHATAAAASPRHSADQRDLGGGDEDEREQTAE